MEDDGYDWAQEQAMMASWESEGKEGSVLGVADDETGEMASAGYPAGE